MSETQNIYDATEYLQFRDVLLPVKDWSHRFAHQAVEHHIIYRAGVAIDQLGPSGRVFSYVLVCSNGISKAPFQNAFTGIYYRLYEAFRNKEPGDLIDPIHGPIWAAPGDWDSHGETSMLDGLEVRLTFKEDVPVTGARTDQAPTFAGLKSTSVALDEQAKIIPWERPEEIPATQDPFTAVSSVLAQSNRMREKVSASFMSVANKANKIERNAEELGSNGGPPTNAIRLAARKLRYDATRAANAPPQDAAGVVVQAAYDTPKTLSEIAAETGSDIATIIRLNVWLAKQPFVEAGRTINIIRGKKRSR